MSTVSTIATIVRPQPPESRGLILEQEPVEDETVGTITKLTIVLTMAARLFGLDDPEPVDCGMDGDAFETNVFVYPYEPELIYNIGVTNGALGSGTLGEHSVTEILSFSLDTEQSVRYPVNEFISASWVGDVWSADGEVVGQPGIEWDDGTVTVAEKIYGSLEVRYTTLRYAHSLRVAAREDAVENVFQSVVWANWNGGVKLLEIDAPPGAEEDYAAGVECTGGEIGEVNPDDDPPVPPPGQSADRTINLNYCRDY